MTPFETGEPMAGADLLFVAMDQVFPGETPPAYVPPKVVPVEHRDPSFAARAASWCTKALEGRAAELAQMQPDTGRNHALYKAAIAGLRHAQAGYVEAERVVALLRDAAIECGLGYGEIEATLGSASRKAEQEGPEHPPIDGSREAGKPDDAFSKLQVDEKTGEVLAPSTEAAASAVSIDAEAFWTSRPVLEHVRQFARARLCSPWAVLGVVLARVITATPHYIVLPDLVGSYGSLNLFVALVGPSGGGKGASESAAADCLDMEPIDSATVGSGEGIGHLYAHREKGEVVRDRHAVLFTVPEVDNLVALAGRQGATLLPQLRSAWSGEQLGFAYADKNKALPIKRHDYRMGLVLGVQPGRAGALLDDADGGTPQRFLWMPTADPDAPDETPKTPEPWRWDLPAPWVADAFESLTVLPIPDEARQTIGLNRLSRLRGQGEALDGHALLTRLKTAAALCLLDQRKAVSLEDWELSGQVMEVSLATRQSVVAYLTGKAREANRAKGAAEGARAVLVEETVVDAGAQRVARKLMAHVAAAPRARADLRRLIAHRDRAFFDDALERLVEAGQVVVEATDKGDRISPAK